MAATNEIATFLDNLRAVRRRLARSDVAPDSPAAHFANLATNERGSARVTDRLIVVADLWTLVASEQMASMATIIRASEHAFGLFPLARSVIEHSAAVVWVLDPAVSPERRCARAALSIDRSNEKLVTAAAHLADKSDPTYLARRRTMREFRDEIVSDFPRDTDLNARPKLIAGETPLSPTAMVVHFAEAGGFNSREWEGIYDYLCAAANHPTLAAFEFFGESETTSHLPTMSDDFLDRLMRAVVAPCLMALQGYAAYCGWDPSMVEGLTAQAAALFPESAT